MYHFKVIVGRNGEKKKVCGMNDAKNVMEKTETDWFICRPNAISNQLTITIPGEMKILTLCEVSALGKGTVELIISTSIST